MKIRIFKVLSTVIAIMLVNMLSLVNADSVDTKTEVLQSDGKLTIERVIMPKLPAVSRTAAIYLTIINHSTNDVTLTDVKTTAAHHAMFHQTTEKNGVSSMQHHDQITIPAGTTFEFRQGSYHIMLMGLDHEVIQSTFELKLSFANHEDILVNVTPES